VISRIPDIWRKAKNAKNSLAPINKLPPETLAQVAAFLEPGRQLVNATAVCQHWRATLLSFPRLWSTIHCPDPMQFETYLKRSKSAPLEVRLAYFSLFESLVPHTSRLAALAIRVDHSSDFNQVAQYLPNPIPTLRKFGITSFGSDNLDLPPGINNDHFLHVKELQLEDISSFQAPHAFPHVTELTWYVGPGRGGPVQLSGLLDTLEQLLVLEQVDLIFQTSQHTSTDPPPHVVTLPNVQQMSLCRCEVSKVGIPPSLISSGSQNSHRSLWIRCQNCHRHSALFPLPPLANASQTSPNFQRWKFACVGKSVESVFEALLKRCWSIVPLRDHWQKQPIAATVGAGAGSLCIPYGG
jgi:hypothetical protein